MPPCHPRCHPHCRHGKRARKEAGITERPPPSYDDQFYRYSRWDRSTPPSSRGPSPEPGREAPQTATREAATINVSKPKRKKREAKRKKKKERAISHAFHKRISNLRDRFTRVFHRHDPSQATSPSSPPPQPRPAPLSTAPSHPAAPAPPYSTSSSTVERTEGSRRRTRLGTESSAGVDRIRQRHPEPRPSENRMVSADVSVLLLAIYSLWEFLYEEFIFIVEFIMRKLSHTLGHYGQRSRLTKNRGTKHERE